MNKPNKSSKASGPSGCMIALGVVILAFVAFFIGKSSGDADVSSTILPVLAIGIIALAGYGYSINKKNTGYYVVLPFKADAELPKELDRRLRINENVMRHIIVCQDEE